MSTLERDAPAPVAPSRGASRRDLLLLLAVWAVTRVAVLIGVAPTHDSFHRPFVRRLARQWDGWWYTQIAQYGYHDGLRAPFPGLWHRFSEWAFFPALPLLIRAAHAVTGLPWSVAALLVAHLTGLAAVLAIYRLATTYAGRDAGRAAGLLLVTWPGSAALSLPYSEGLGIASSALALDALLRRRWELAGLFGLVATASRPTGLAMLVAATVVAVVEIARERKPRALRALLAPLLTAVGAVSFAIYGWQRTGDPLIWRHAEALWSQRLDLLVGLGRLWVDELPHAEPRSLLQVMGAVALALLLAVALGTRLSWRDPVVISAAVTLALLLGYSLVGPRPRMLLSTFPLLVLAAPHIPPRVVWVASAVGTVLTGVVAYYWFTNVTP